MRNFVGNPERSRQLRRTRHRQDASIKQILKGRSCEDVNWIYVNRAGHEFLAGLVKLSASMKGGKILGQLIN
jgi:hypothetical protein